MNILYIGYWNLYDPLTISTVYPSLSMLRMLQPNATLIFVNVQREPLPSALPGIFSDLNILYYPALSGDRFINKVKDFMQGPTLIGRLCKSHSIDKVVARGTPAGALAYLAWKKTSIPFFIESFEPHADYMLESEVWGKYDPRFLLQRYWEKKEMKNATGLMPVTVNYQRQLIKEGIDPDKIKVVPCGVSQAQFAFNEEERQKLRSELGISPNAMVGLYAGKYDGLYLAEDAFKLYKICFEQLPDFTLILLSSVTHHSWIDGQIRKHGLPVSRVFVRSVRHDQVSTYCSASDFAFATYKPGKSKAFLSPVKVGEYWVNGLPILMTRGIGDESPMIEGGFGGILFEADNINHANFIKKINNLVAIVRNPGSRKNIATVGAELRSFEKLKLAYQYFLAEG